MRDVIIVGAGCIGSYLARLLAEEGLDVLVLEKDQRVGDSVNCSGIIGKEAFASIDLPTETIQDEIGTLTVFGPSGGSVVYRPPAPLGYVVDRVRFDQKLAERAVQSGASYSLGSWVEGIERGRDFVSLAVRAGEEKWPIRAKVCVLATGFGGKFFHQLNLGRIDDWIQGVQLEAGMEGVENAEIYLGKEVAPGSFAWVVPAEDGRCKVGLLAKAGGGDLLRRFIEGPRIAHRLKVWDGKMKASLLPLGWLPRTSAARLLVIGEAAGQVKITTAGGIYYGLLCARIASEVLRRAFEKGDFTESALAPYDAEWKAKLEAERSMGGALRRVFSKMSDRQIDALIHLAQVDGVIPLVNRLFQFDWHASLISSLLKLYLPGSHSFQDSRLY
jgi:geranylgeranyl reductase family protein